MKILFNVPLSRLMLTDKEEFNFLCADTQKYIEDNFEVIWNEKEGAYFHLYTRQFKEEVMNQSMETVFAE